MRFLTVCLLMALSLTGCEIWKVPDKPGSWEYVTDFPGQGRERAVAFPIGDEAYIGLGFRRKGDMVYDNSDSIYLYDFWKYDPAADVWTRLADFPGETTRDVLGFALAGRGYILIEDRYDNTQVWAYDPAENTWEQLPDFPGYSRSWGVCFTLGDKAYYGLGELDDTELDERPGATDLWEYDPSTGTWIQKAAFPGIPREYANVFTLVNKAYICTGRGADTVLTLRDVWEYNTTADTWTQKTDYAGYPRYKATSFSLSGKGYLGAGWVSTNPGSVHPVVDFWEYDPGNNRWKTIEPYLTYQLDGISLELDGRSFIGLGENSRNYYPVEIYQLKNIE